MLGRFKAIQRNRTSYDLTIDGLRLPHAYAFTIENHVGEPPTVTVSFRATAEVVSLDPSLPVRHPHPDTCTHQNWTTIHNGLADDTTRICDNCGTTLTTDE